MKSYLLPSKFFRKKWVWFETPHDISNVDMVTFFSYDDAKTLDFKKSEDLTSLIDLSALLEEIWSRTREQFIRVQVERGKRRGITVRQDNADFPLFRPIYERFRRLKGLPPESWEVIESNGLLFSAWYEGKIMAGMVCIEDGHSMRLWKLASVRLEGAEKSMQKIAGEANRLVIWEAIRIAKERGYRFFDLGGIHPESSDPGIKAVAAFKESFGGERKVTYYYHKAYSPLLKAWLRVRRFVRP